MHKPLIVLPLLPMIALCCTLSSEVQAACSCQCVNGQLQLYCGPSDDIDQAQPCTGVCRPPSPGPPQRYKIIITPQQLPHNQDDRLLRRPGWRGWPANELGRRVQVVVMDKLSAQKGAG